MRYDPRVIALAITLGYLSKSSNIGKDERARDLAAETSLSLLTLLIWAQFSLSDTSSKLNLGSI